MTTIRLLGFGDIGNYNLPFFILILVIYCLTICGNLMIITMVSYSKNLHTPMYIFLSHLSIADTMLSSDITPTLLKNIIHGGAFMSFSLCITQLYFFCSSEGAESLLLMVMSYDRYLAICAPLHYMSIMNQLLCNKLVLLSWFLSNCATLFLTFGVSQLEFCGPNTIDHFFCDFSPLLALSCSDTTIVQIEDILIGIPLAVTPFLLIVISYMYIISAILKIPSLTSRLKAFSTCSSHLTIVCVFYGTLIVMYMLPSNGMSLLTSKVLAMMYTVITPFINPLIYSLRNKEIKDALKMLYNKKTWH